MCTTVDTSFILTKNLQNVFLISVTLMLDVILVIKWFYNWKYQKMHFTKNVALNWHSSMIFFWKIQMFEFECFMIFDATVPSQLYRYQKTFCNIWFFCKNEACVKYGIHKRHNPNLVTERLFLYISFNLPLNGRKKFQKTNSQKLLLQLGLKCLMKVVFEHP